MIWKRQTTLEALNAMGEGNMVGLLDIQFDHIDGDSIAATMPVDHRTHQPFGLLHGGASVVLAETLGSVVVVIRSGRLECSMSKVVYAGRRA